MRSMRRWRTGSWLVLIAAFALGMLGWKWLLKASVPIIGFWLALMALYGFLLFQLFYLLLAPATEGEQDDLRRAFTYFLFGRLQALGAVDAGQPRNPSEPRAGPGLWLLDARSALAIECEGRLTRIAGPGLVWISEREQVTAFVDLHPLTERLLRHLFQSDPQTIQSNAHSDQIPMKGRPYPLRQSGQWRGRRLSPITLLIKEEELIKEPVPHPNRQLSARHFMGKLKPLEDTILIDTSGLPCLGDDPPDRIWRIEIWGASG